MPTPQSQINAELFKRINSLEKVSSELSGYFKGMVENTKELISLMRNEQKHHKVVVSILASLLAFCIAAIIYGAIGKDGLHAVRNTMPHSMLNEAVTSDDGLDMWMWFNLRNNKRKGKV